MSGTNQLQQPLGQNVPLPGGQLYPANPVPRRDTQPAMNRMAGPGQQPRSLTGPTPPMDFDTSRRTLAEEHTRNRSALQEITTALRKLDAVRKGLGKLAEKQDTVTMEDVVHEAGKLVSHGVDPLALAGVLADAPQEGGGEALGAWVAGHAQTAVQAEGQMMQQKMLLGHNLAASAMHMLMAHANGQARDGTLPGPVAPDMGGGNALGGMAQEQV